jgi:hypothetical protein
MGSLIDTLLFTPRDMDLRFYIGEEKLPSKAIASIIRDYYNSIIKENLLIDEMNKAIPVELPHLNFESAIGLLEQCANRYSYKDGDEEKVGWNTGWKAETRVRTLLEKGADYYASLKASKGRKIISAEMNLEAAQICEILRADPKVRDYFVPNEDNHLMFQLELYTTYPLINGQNMPLKGALDIVRFNHKDKTAQIIDFKSSYSAFGFVSSIRQFGYCDQLSYYDFLLREWMIEACEGKYCDYKVLPPMNIVIDIADRIPYVYEYQWRDIALAADGNREFLFNLFQTHDHNVKIKKGWKKLLDEIGWHWQNDLWDKPKELYENDKITVNLLNN